MIEITLNNLDNVFNNLNIELGNLNGQCVAIKKSIEDNEEDIIELKDKKERETKAVELLNFVQKVTREKTQKQFEQLVTYAIQYVFEDDKFEFALEFDRRGTLGTLEFNIKTPDLQEKADIIDTDSGGVINIVSLALRLVLLETFVPRNEGFIVFDESFAGLSEEYLPKASQFLKEISAKFNRQIIMITHKQEFKTHADKVLEIK